MTIWLFLQAIATEAMAVYPLMQPSPVASEWLVALGLHIFSSVSMALFVWKAMPQNLQVNRTTTFVFLFTFHLFLPIVGFIGSTISIVVSLHFPHPHSDITWQACKHLDLSSPDKEKIEPHFGAGALREILLYNKDSARRLLAIQAVQYLPKQQSVPLLQLALKDLDDDVRLLAYASLETIETDVNQSISLFKKQYKQSDKAEIAFDIAQQYWELCYLGIADGVIKNYYLEQAEAFLISANNIQEKAPFNLLLGRVYLEQKKTELAEIHLSKAQTGGLKMTQVAPYLAEAAYIAKDYQKLQQYLAYFPSGQSSKLSQLKAFWS